jgi:DNA-binding NtrC family response regulator
VLLCNDAEITEDLLSERVTSAFGRAAHNGAGSTLAAMVADFERGRIRDTIVATGGNKSEAARRLGLTYRGLLAKMQRLGSI